MDISQVCRLRASFLLISVGLLTLESSPFPDPWKFGGNVAGYCPYIDSTEMVGELSSTLRFNVAFHSDSATAGSYDRNFEEFLGNCIIQPNDLMNEGNADEGSDAAASQVVGRRKRWKLCSVW